MVRIKIHDLPVDMRISRDELKRIRGGTALLYTPDIGLTNTIPVMFNPEEVTISKTIEWKDHK